MVLQHRNESMLGLRLQTGIRLVDDSRPSPVRCADRLFFIRLVML
ncbi:MAG: hypothetical protein ACTXOO_00245 [Sodalis sp. (in: enterobacteria)]